VAHPAGRVPTTADHVHHLCHSWNISKHKMKIDTDNDITVAATCILGMHTICEAQTQVTQYENVSIDTTELAL
jgi:hypothetical protein